jgi:hypothetical protein
MNRMIFKKADIEEWGYDELKPGEWGLARPMTNGKLTPYICTPEGHFGGLGKHDVAANGDVNPSVLIIRGEKEVFHEFITLENWEATE